MKPTLKNPRTIIAHVAGSGTPETAKLETSKAFEVDSKATEFISSPPPVTNPTYSANCWLPLGGVTPAWEAVKLYVFKFVVIKSVLKVSGEPHKKLSWEVGARKLRVAVPPSPGPAARKFPTVFIGLPTVFVGMAAIPLLAESIAPPERAAISVEPLYRPGAGLVLSERNGEPLKPAVSTSDALAPVGAVRIASNATAKNPTFRVNITPSGNTTNDLLTCSKVMSIIDLKLYVKNVYLIGVVTNML
jgi:hypothetical protein